MKTFLIILQKVLPLAALLFLSALFASSETAFMSLSNLKVQQLCKEKRRRSSLIRKLKADNTRLLSTVLIGINLVNNFASSLAVSLAISIIGESGVGLATVIMTIFVLLFAEIVPKTVAANSPVECAQILAPFIRIIEILLFPFVAAFAKITQVAEIAASKFFNENLPLVTEEELKMLVDIGNQEGTLESGEKELMHKIFEFTDLHVHQIMTERPLIRALPLNANYMQCVALFKDSGFSRLPVYKNDLDGICGLVHYKDLLFCSKKGADFSLGEIMHEPCFVPETKTATDLLHLLIKQKQNFAIAVDENGCNSGIVTLDDVLGAVFGRLSDEYDKNAVAPENRIEFINKNELRLPGDMLLSDVNNILGFNLESEFYKTLAGWMLEQFGFLPAAGDLLRCDKAVFVVEQQNQRRIQKVRIKYYTN